MSESSSKTATAAGGKVVERAKSGLRVLGDNHEKLADHADTVAKVSNARGGGDGGGGFVAAPTGLTAVGVAIGVVSAPAIVTAAPVLVAVAGGAIFFSTVASLYSKARRRRQKRDRSS